MLKERPFRVLTKGSTSPPSGTGTTTAVPTHTPTVTLTPTGTATNTPTSIPMTPGVLVLDDSDDHAETQDHSELGCGDEAGEDLTIEAWTNLQSGTLYDYKSIFHKPQSYSLSTGFDLTPNLTSCITFILWWAPDPDQWGFSIREWPPYS